jgi:hypothetical protein
VHRWLDVQRTTGAQCTCPYCRQPLRFSALVHDASIQQQLEALHVLCPNAAAGCGAVLSRAEVARHLQDSCALQPVACSFCGKPGLRADIQAHEATSCSQRPVPCINARAGCSAMVPLCSMLLHVDHNCGHTTARCALCQQEVPRCVFAGVAVAAAAVIVLVAAWCRWTAPADDAPACPQARLVAAPAARLPGAPAMPLPRVGLQPRGCIP